jgi:hypothetical protein
MFAFLKRAARITEKLKTRSLSRVRAGIYSSIADFENTSMTISMLIDLRRLREITVHEGMPKIVSC